MTIFILLSEVNSATVAAVFHDAKILALQVNRATPKDDD
jgi:hypothetical protein